MNETNSHEFFSADRPIVRIADDRLGRENFARKIAAAVRGWHGRDSLVIALFGKWGSGKSSVKNMIAEVLGGSSPGALVVDFSVWQFSNRQQLTEDFFDQIGTKLGRGSIGSEKTRKALVRSIRSYATRLTSLGDLLPLIQTGGSTVLFIAGFLMIGTAFPRLHAITAILGTIAIIGGATLRWVSGAATTIADYLSVRSETGRRTLEEVKEEVSTKLRDLEKPVLMILDDLDRLSPNETQEMLQLVKANADFPNVVYLVLCQRDVVEGHLAESLNVIGRDYLEKIVQVAFDIPALDRTKLHSVLFEGLDKLIADPAVQKRFERVRWGNLFHGGLEPYFETLRDVNRYLSALAFQVSVFRDQGVFEVNPIDLIGLEVLRFFEPEVYRRVAANKDVLTNSLQHGGPPSKEAELRKEVQAIIDEAPQGNRERVTEIIKQLFPRAAGVLGGVRYSAEADNEWTRDLRVSAPDIFNRYFNFAIPTGDVSEVILSSVIDASQDREKLRERLEALDAQGLLVPVLDRLEAYKESIPLTHSEALATALFDVGDRLSDDTPGMFAMSSEMHAVRIIYWNLKQEPNAKRRNEILLKAVRNTTGLNVPVHFVSIEAQAAEKATNDASTRRTVDDEGLAELKALCVEKIAAAANDGSLARSSDLVSIFFRWEEWAGKEPVQAFANELAATPSGALRLVTAFLNRSVSHGLEDRVGREKWYITLGNLERFTSYEAIEQSLAKVDQTSLTEAERRGIEKFREAVERRRAGKRDFGVGFDDD